MLWGRGWNLVTSSFINTRTVKTNLSKWHKVKTFHINRFPHDSSASFIISKSGTYNVKKIIFCRASTLLIYLLIHLFSSLVLKNLAGTKVK